MFIEEMFKEKWCKQCRQVMFKWNYDKMARKTTNTQNSTKHSEQQEVIYIQNKLFLRFGFVYLKAKEIPFI